MKPCTGQRKGKGDGVRSHRNHNRTRPRLVRLYTVHYGKSRRLRGCVSKIGYSCQVSTVDQGSSLRTSNLVPYLQYVAKPKILPSQHQLAWPRPAVTQYKGAIARSFASFLSLLRPRWLFRPILDFICLIPSLVPPPQLTYHLPSQLIFVPLFLLSSYPLLSIGLSRLLFTLTLLVLSTIPLDKFSNQQSEKEYTKRACALTAAVCVFWFDFWFQLRSKLDWLFFISSSSLSLWFVSVWLASNTIRWPSSKSASKVRWISPSTNRSKHSTRVFHLLRLHQWPFMRLLFCNHFHDTFHDHVEFITSAHLNFTFCRVVCPFYWACMMYACPMHCHFVYDVAFIVRWSGIPSLFRP